MTSSQEISVYEMIRLENIQERNRLMKSMGIDMEPPQEPARKKRRQSTPKEMKNMEPTRRSARISGIGVKNELANGPTGDNTLPATLKKPLGKRPLIYGEICGVVIGDSWRTRLECNYAGVHRPTVAGIHPGPQGAFSVVLSGGYEDDVDHGLSFTYTGCGGRDLKGTRTNPKNLRTGPQTKDQILNTSNNSLVMNFENRMPVRVIRGYKLQSKFAPESGYRYDGLYTVDKWWHNSGASGYRTYKYLFRRVKEQSPPPWSRNK